MIFGSAFGPRNIILNFNENEILLASLPKYTILVDYSECHNNINNRIAVISNIKMSIYIQNVKKKKIHRCNVSIITLHDAHLWIV